MPRAKKRLMDIITIFPEMIAPYTDASILGRAQKNGLIKITAHNLRDWTTDKHQKVDDTPYGGGAGMLMRVDVFDRAVKGLKSRKGRKGLKGMKTRIILTSASGKLFTQKDARRLAKYDQLIFLCGRYEGVDHRVEKYIADETFSIGNYVLTGGELPALVMIDAIARMVPGVLGSKESLESESHDKEGELEYPQYTKPEKYFPPLPRGDKGGLPKCWKVPPILLSGDHKKIAEWRHKHSQKKNPH